MHQYTPLDAGYLPAGFDVNPTGGSGMITVGSVNVPDGQAEDVVEAEQALYENGDQFVYIETAKGRDKDVPDGQATKVNGEDAVIVTGLTGTLSMEPLLPEDARPDGAAGMTVTTAGDGPTFVTGEAGLTVSGGDNAQPSTEVVGGTQAAGELRRRRDSGLLRERHLAHVDRGRHLGADHLQSAAGRDHQGRRRTGARQFRVTACPPGQAKSPPPAQSRFPPPARSARAHPSVS